MQRSNKKVLFLVLLTWIVVALLFSTTVSAARPKEKVVRTTLAIEVGSSATRMSVVVGDSSEPKLISVGPGTRSTPRPLESNWTTEGFLLIKDGTDESLYVHPSNTLFNLDHSIVLRSRSHNTYDNRPNITGQQAFTLIDITAKYLQELTASAESILGHNVTFVAIIAPGGQSVRATAKEIVNDEYRGNYTYYGKSYSWYTEQRVVRVMEEALRAAGVRCPDLFSDPYKNASAVTFFFAYNMGIDSRVVLVYRLGGSTFEVSVHNSDGASFTTMSSTYHQHLGGNDFNQRVVDHLLLAHKNNTGQDLSSDHKFLLRLGSEVEKAKRMLSVQDRVRIEIESLHPGGQGLSEQLTRSQFEDLNMDLFTKTITAIDEAIKNSVMYSKNDIQDIMFSGGSTNIPFLQSAVREYFGRHTRYHVSNHPETAAVLGAAKLSHWDQEYSYDDADVCCFGETRKPLGIEIAGGVMFEYTDRNSYENTNNMYMFTTATDNQDRVVVRVFLGDDARTSENIFLGGIELTGIAPALKGVPDIRVRISTYLCGNSIDLEVMDVASGITNATTILLYEDHGEEIKHETLVGGAFELEPVEFEYFCAT
ncbi:MAG: Hsp70 protein-domain-containing protein [Linnemannia gamsii]|nr:MAG: Hsp70 protein-domain-containing protein [Linnemannia gamsii]